MYLHVYIHTKYTYLYAHDNNILYICMYIPECNLFSFNTGIHMFVFRD